MDYENRTSPVLRVGEVMTRTSLSRSCTYKQIDLQLLRHSSRSATAPAVSMSTCLMAGSECAWICGPR